MREERKIRKVTEEVEKEVSVHITRDGMEFLNPFWAKRHEEKLDAQDILNMWRKAGIWYLVQSESGYANLLDLWKKTDSYETYSQTPQPQDFPCYVSLWSFNVDCDCDMFDCNSQVDTTEVIIVNRYELKTMFGFIEGDLNE